ncbi:hypothetical protein BJQ89_01982 [Arthrobacter sp. ES1]|nr:hypothetical protein [Arthrobacter sp. ES1]
MAGECDLQGGDEVRRSEGLDHVGHGAGVAGALDEFLLAECGEQDHGGDPGLDDFLSSGDAIHDWHLDVHQDEVRLKFLGELDGLFAIVRFTDDVVAFTPQDLDDVEPDEGLVLGDNHAARRLGRGV